MPSRYAKTGGEATRETTKGRKGRPVLKSGIVERGAASSALSQSAAEIFLRSLLHGNASLTVGGEFLKRD
jgi:hypothetical protein